MNFFAEGSSRPHCFVLLRCMTVLAIVSLPALRVVKVMMPKAKDSGASIGCRLEIKTDQYK